MAVKFYKETRMLILPQSLKEQLSRAAPSIALNLAEGYGRYSYKDRNKYFQIAFGSARECQAILILSDLKETKAFQLLDELAAHLYKLIKYGRE